MMNMLAVSVGRIVLAGVVVAICLVAALAAVRIIKGALPRGHRRRTD